jgi:hypothetical protein
MAEQKAQETFRLSDSRDILEKLQWELDTLFCRQRHDIRVCQYHAFNCAITAWHVTDWLWQDMSAEFKAERRWNTCTEFQNYVREECPELKLCYQIALGSKHCRLTGRNANPAISAKISDGEGYDYGNPIIVEGDKERNADQVFQLARNWFEAFVERCNIFPEEPFFPVDDP